MKTKKQFAVIAAGVLFASVTFGALADDKWLGDSGSNWQEHIQSTKSRAEVIAELNQARAQGLLSTGDDSAYPREPASTINRARSGARADVTGTSGQGDLYKNSYSSNNQ